MPWYPPLNSYALNAVSPYCGYVSGVDADYAEVTSREAVIWPSAGSVAYHIHADNQPVLSVAGACTITKIVLWPASSGGEFDAACVLDPAIVFTESGTLTLVDMQLVCPYS